MRFDLSIGETLNIGEGTIKVTLEQKSGSRARLKVQADDGVLVGLDREELPQKERLTKPTPA